MRAGRVEDFMKTCKNRLLNALERGLGICTLLQSLT